MWRILLWISVATISVLALKYAAIPYLWIFLSLSAALIVMAVMTRVRRALWINLACITLVLSIFEYYFWTLEYVAVKESLVDERTFAEVPDDELGWAPQPDTVSRQRLSHEGELLYDVTYTIGPNGLRVSSGSTGDHDTPSEAECVLVFGGSFTFGQGLEDDQTLPSQINSKSTTPYRMYNFGVMGYGAHQMLSALQHGLVDDAVRCDRARVTQVFYQGISDHVRRAAGSAWWNTRGPRYRLTEDGGVRLDGRFEDDDDDDEDRSLAQLLGTQIIKSKIYGAVVEGRYVHKYSQKTIDLYLEIVDESRRFVRSSYPCAAFHVLWWDEDDIDNRAAIDGLRNHGIDVRLMSDILPGYKADDLNEAYVLDEADTHPNALANDLIAQYVVREILSRPGRCDASRQAS